ncbi:hypothetical protein FC694_16935 [Bacillus wiedmannii]|uniref:Uncharacterized protein n=1 Tax=Bacillus wiedmannii TaxID=1890302 RepID=A0A4U2MTD1_9BACI|nr:hypothetical protein [Bacillus wiedmannii]TKH14630.1 hypothetical protein FC694_16935 [Bacillus wiedmannii]
MTQIMFIPGIKGSQLYQGNNKRWFPATEEDLMALKLENKLKSEGILDTVNAFFWISERIYQGVLDEFGNEENFHIYSYDWRQSIFDHVDELVRSIVSIHNTTDEEVLLVAHSMGGMLGKLAILKLDEMGLSNVVKDFITIGTPWKGAPDAYKVLEYGEPGIYKKFWQIKGLFDGKKTRDLARTFPSAYQLLPSEEYYKLPDGKFVIGSSNEELNYYDIKSKVQQLYNLQHKVEKEQPTTDIWKVYIEPLHRAMSEPLPKNISHECVIGVDCPTFYSIPEKDHRKLRKYKTASEIKNGDSVVPIISAIPTHDANIYHVKEIEHQNLCSSDEVNSFIKWVYEGKQTELPQGIYQGDLSNDIELKLGKMARVMCPVDTTILDDENKYVAGVMDPSLNAYSELAVNGDIEYFQVGNAKYLYMKKDEDLKFKINAYEDGVAEVAVQDFDRGEETELVFKTIPVSPKKSAELIIRGEKSSNDKALPNAELIFEGEHIIPKNVKKLKGDDKKAVLPEIKVNFKPVKGTKRASRRQTYSGPVVLNVESQFFNEIEELLYSVDGREVHRFDKENKAILDFESGCYEIEVFGKDVYNRAIVGTKEKIWFDKSVPETKINLYINPDKIYFNFNFANFNSKVTTYFRFIKQETELNLPSPQIDDNVECEWFYTDTLNEELELPSKCFTFLKQNPKGSIIIEYYSENEFGVKEKPRSFTFSLRRIPILMWTEHTSIVTANMILTNIFGATIQPDELDQFKVLQKKQNKYYSLELGTTIGDDVISVVYEYDQYRIEVFFSEKYSLFFSGPPTELLKLNQTYAFSFELRTERGNEKITITNPIAKLQPITKGTKLKSRPIKLQLKGKMFYGKFEVDSTFKLYKHKLIITDSKNLNPPLRESILNLAEEEGEN